MAAALVFAVLPGLVIVGWLLGGAVLAEGRCRRENARRQTDYRAACATAKREGQPPPFPPNQVRWGR